jgi:hypothetical protein
MVTPLDVFWQELGNQFNRQTSQLARMNNSNNQQTTVVLQVDGKELARTTFQNASKLSQLNQLDLSWL